MFFILFFSLLSLFAEEKNSPPSAYTAIVKTGDVSYIAYTKPGENRPLTFVFNGGPGSSSIWLHIGAMGPKRVLSPEEGQTAIPPYKMVDNEESILDLTDLVFIDPSGTGLSQVKPIEENETFYSIKGDIQSIGNLIRDYLTENKRWNSPKYLAGESYGAMRAAGLAEFLQSEHQIYLNGVILISPALDFQTLIFTPDNPLAYFLFLPTYATTAWYHGRFRPEASLREVAEEARRFAFETYGPALLCQKCRDQKPIWEKVAEMTGLPWQTIHQNQGCLPDWLFLSEFLGNERKLVGRFDSRYESFALPPPLLNADPSSAVIEGIFAGAFHDYLQRELNSPQSYRLFSPEVNQRWNFTDYTQLGYPNLMNGLRNALLKNPHLKVFVGCGYFDLATPFATAEYCFDHLNVPGISVQMEYYEGGHMYYLNPSERIKFKQDLIRFYQGGL